MKYKPSRAKIVARINSREILDGRRSICSRLHRESRDAVAERLSENLNPSFTDDDLISALARFCEKFPQHFMTHKEAEEALRRDWAAKNTPRRVADVTRDALAKMSGPEKLDVANGVVQSPPAFVTADNDDE
jgi:hypothetical protein